MIATFLVRFPAVVAFLFVVELPVHVLFRLVFPAHFVFQFLFYALTKLTFQVLSAFRARVLFVILQVGFRVRFVVGVLVRAAAPTPVRALFNAIYQVPIHAQALLVFRVLSFALILSHARTLADVPFPDLFGAESDVLAPSLSLSLFVVVSFLSRLRIAVHLCAGPDRNHTSRVASF